MNHVKVNARIIRDNTGAQVVIPILLIERNGEPAPLAPLLDYLLENLTQSLSWMDKLIQAVGMLLDYMAANHACFDKPEELFDAFTRRVYSGTIGEDGQDPSGLYWLPKNRRTARPLLIALSTFSDWMHRKYGTKPLNSWREATVAEQRLNWAAFINKSQRSFLGHLDSYRDAAEAAKKARSTKQRRAPVGSKGPTKAFPEGRMEDLLFKGFVVPGKEKSPDIVERYNWRDIGIAILQDYGGLRESEPFHVWVHDVMPDPNDPESALVRIYHPIDGAAPRDYRGADGRYLANREAYLLARYPGYRPRNLETGNRHAGWKNPKMDDTTQNYMQVFWNPPAAGRLFMQVYRYYMYQRMRAKIDAAKHPYLFVSFHGGQHGEPYTIDAYRQAHERAVRRIGLVPAKMNGTTTQGHRHAYGQRARRGKADARVIQAGLHHKSPESQEVYTEPTIEAVTQALEQASQALQASGQPTPLPDLNALPGRRKAQLQDEGE